MLLEQAVKAILTAIISGLLGWRREAKAEQAHRDVGRLTAEREQAREGERVNADLADQAAKRVSEDEAIARLDRGDA